MGGPLGERLQFGKREFDRIEVGTVGWEKPELGPYGFDRGTDLWLFVDREVIEDDDVPGTQRGDQDLLHVGEEGLIVDRAVEYRRGTETVEPARGVGLPVATGRVIAEARAPRTPSVAAEQIRRHAAFIEEDVLARVAQRLPQLLLPARRGDIRPSLLVGVYLFL